MSEQESTTPNIEPASDFSLGKLPVENYNEYW
jgi:hypothetical protein